MENNLYQNLLYSRREYQYLSLTSDPTKRRNAIEPSRLSLSLFRLCNKMGRLRRRRDFFLPIRISDSAKRRAENRSARSSPSNTLVIPNGRRAVMNVSGDSRQRGMPPATNNAALFIGTAFNPRVSVCASVTFRRRRY